MVWGKTSDREQHRKLGKNLTAAYHGPAGLPAPREGQIPGHWKSAPTGSRGGAPIWVMGEAWMTIRFKGSACNKCGTSEHLSSQHEAAADPDGFAVYGRYPKGWLRHVLKLRLLGDVKREDILHVCSGTLSESERWTVDVRPDAKPRVIADGRQLPFRDGAFPAAMLDPPYSDQYAKNLYGVENPRPSWLLREAARVVAPSGRIGLLHIAIPFAPEGCHLVKVYGVSCGVGFRIRAFTVWEKDQESVL